MVPISKAAHSHFPGPPRPRRRSRSLRRNLHIQTERPAWKATATTCAVCLSTSTSTRRPNSVKNLMCRGTIVNFKRKNAAREQEIEAEARYDCRHDPSNVQIVSTFNSLSVCVNTPLSNMPKMHSNHIRLEI